MSHTRSRFSMLGVAAAMSVLVVALALLPGFTQAAWTDEVATTTAAFAGDWGAGGDGDGGISPGNDDTVISDIQWAIASPVQACANLTVTTESTTPVDWAVDVDMTSSPWNGVDPSLGKVENGANAAIDGTVLHLTGIHDDGAPFNASSNNTPLSSAQVAKIRLCVYDGGDPPVGDADWYTTVQHAPVRDGNKVCTSMDVIGLVDEDEYPFYYGWQATMDLTEAWEMLDDAGLSYNFTSMTPGPEGDYGYHMDPGTVSVDHSTYALTSAVHFSLHGTASGTVTWCLNGIPRSAGTTASSDAGDADDPANSGETSPAPAASATPVPSAEPTVTPSTDPTPESTPTESQ
ncbi:hypothetical protein [Demequina globuliformis]|uniref:hypothetical protein n=1 Tax=Demequina globuliformis TaxID=676202 RepID=UPI000784044B|nr:hypothetical protein [Demequina globuliformis]